MDFSSPIQRRLPCAHNILHSSTFPTKSQWLISMAETLPASPAHTCSRATCQPLEGDILKKSPPTAGARSGGQGPRSMNRPAFGPRPVMVSITAAPGSSSVGDLHLSLQNRRLRPPRTRPERTTAVSKHTPDAIGQWLVHMPNPTTLAFWAWRVHSSAQRHPVWYLLPAVVSALSALKPNTYRLRTVPPDYSGTNQSGPFTDTLDMVGHEAPPSSRNPVDAFQQGNLQTSHHPTTDSTRDEPPRRFQPYHISRVHPNEHRYTEAGPSTLVPPPVQYVAPQMPQPPGGISETPADAENDQPYTEEDQAPVSHFTVLMFLM